MSARAGRIRGEATKPRSGKSARKERKREKASKKAVAPVQHRYDYVLIDCPPSLGLLTVNALTAAHTVLIPVQCEYLSLEGLTNLMQTLRLVRQSLNPPLHVIGVLLTMFDPRTNL